jgi:hypothetical protein
MVLGVNVLVVLGQLFRGFRLPRARPLGIRVEDVVEVRQLWVGRSGGQGTNVCGQQTGRPIASLNEFECMRRRSAAHCRVSRMKQVLGTFE